MSMRERVVVVTGRGGRVSCCHSDCVLLLLDHSVNGTATTVHRLLGHAEVLLLLLLLGMSLVRLMVVQLVGHQQDVVIVRVVRGAVIVVDAVRVVVIVVVEVVETGDPQPSALRSGRPRVGRRQARRGSGQSLLDNLLAR